MRDNDSGPAGDAARARLALVTGATGYIGGRLVPELLAAGFRVRCVARSPGKLRDRPWHPDVEVVPGDASSVDDVTKAADGVDVAYYLVHSLGSGPQFERRDRETARAFARGTRASGVGRIVYLGGLYPDHEELSPHLDSRREVGEILLDSGVPTAVLRAAMIIGSGSASFEMLRYITERLPLMITPRWVKSRIQPIAVRDVLRYLVGAADLPPEVNRGFDIGGPDVLTYLDMMHRYAEVTGLPRRRVRPLPVLTPSLSSHWVGVVTPVPSGIARPLVESLVHEVVVKERDLAAYIPDPPGGLIGFDHAVELALARVQSLDVSTTWSSAATEGAPSDPLPSDPDWAGGSLYVDEREELVDVAPEDLWAVIEGIGGAHGWYSWSFGWRVRGVLDRIFGGPGLRRGRRHPDTLAVGDALDWWRVEDLDRPRLLRLRAEMRLPGLAWLELIVTQPDEAGPTENGGPTLFRQRALFHPRGLAGQLYWAAIKPFHGIVFGGMQRNIARAAKARSAGRVPSAGRGRSAR
jgi:uncharacterized protein YbjT (DUF2867 family)